VDMVRTWLQTGADVESKPYGFLLRDFDHPLVHDTNLAWVDTEPVGGIESVLDDLDRTFLGTAVGHRFVSYADADLAYSHQDALVAARFQPDAQLAMAKVGLPACIVNPDLTIEEVGKGATEGDYRLVQTTIHRENGLSPKESRQVYEIEAIRAAALGERRFVGYLGDEAAATYSLWSRGIFGVIGNVGTLPKFRMRGIGRTMIFDACSQATSARCEYVLLTTDLFGTPQTMYTTLGFEPVGELRTFLRPRV
ncbi:MAG: GNAT family N-acetyltransferase, partial [Thermoplasmata archaeon]